MALLIRFFFPFSLFFSPLLFFLCRKKKAKRMDQRLFQFSFQMLWKLFFFLLSQEKNLLVSKTTSREAASSFYLSFSLLSIENKTTTKTRAFSY